MKTEDNKTQHTTLKIKNLISEDGYKENISKWQLEHFSSVAKIKNIAQEKKNKYIAEFNYKGEERRIEIYLQKDASNYTPPEYDILYVSNSWFDFNEEITKKISHNWLKNLDKENGIFLHQNVVGSTKPLFENKNSSQKFLSNFSKVGLRQILEEEKDDKIVTLIPTIYLHTP